MAHNPNFPPSLEIQPLTHPGDWDDAFSSENQAFAIQQYGIAGRIWEAAYALILYVNPSHECLFDPPFITADPHYPVTLIELGSGTGIVASRIASTFTGKRATVIVTDLPEVCPLLETNLIKYDLFVRPLSWGNQEHFSEIKKEFLDKQLLTHIICSDLVYFPELLAPLLRSLLHLTSSGAPRVVISYKIRSLSKEGPFWAAFGLYFTFEPVLIHPGGQGVDWERFGKSFEDTMFIFTAYRRPESRGWSIPESDVDLLAGVGAQGTNTAKNDDTFECLLLMAI